MAHLQEGKMHGKGTMRWPREKTSSDGGEADADEGGGMSDHWKALGSSGGVPGIIMRMAAAKGPQYDGVCASRVASVRHYARRANRGVLTRACRR